MKIKYKLILILVVVILAAALPLSLFILNALERDKMHLINHQAEINSRILARSTMNILLMNGGEIPPSMVDAKEMIAMLRPLTADGLVYADAVIISSRKDYNGVILAQFFNDVLFDKEAGVKARRARFTAEEMENLRARQGVTEIDFPGVKDRCYQFVATGSLPERGPLCMGRLVFSQNAILEPTRKLRKIIYAVTAGAIGVVIVIGLFFSRFISNPIADLTEGVERIEVGDLSYQVPVTTNDELGKLAKTFNHMIKMLNLQIVELVSVNRSLTRVDRLKDEFMANMSHELRSPLNGIIGLAESLIEGAGGPVAGSMRHDLSLIISSATRLASLVNDILDFSKLKHKDLNLNMASLDIHPVIGLVLSLLLPVYKNKPVRVKNEVPPGEVIVMGDVNRLQQILLNLVGNAVKFTEKGEVRIYSGVHPVHPGMVTVTVEDTGVGIATEDQARIFESFEQVDGSATRRFGGTGLGLAITRKLVELHDGELWVESEPGKGSRFIFSMKRSEDAPPAEPEMEKKRKAFTALLDISQEDLRLLKQSTGSERPESLKTIMVVDDEPVNLQVMVNHLSLEGYRIVTAMDGEEVMAKLEEGVPDLILLDVMLPRMSGYEVCSHLRERFSKHELPVLMLTAKSKPEDIVAGIEAGANDYCAKPVNRRELIARVNSLIALKESVRTHNELSVIKRDIQIAHDIQNTILLQKVPSSDRIGIVARYLPMTELGGDFFDIRMDDGVTAKILLADVSGHGIPAAFICAMLKVVYTFLAVNGSDPEIMLTGINRSMFQFLGTQFITACYAVIDVEKMEMRQANAGHWPVVVVRDGMSIADRTNGMPIGWEEKESYKSVTVSLRPGDRILLYTDGIIEARNGENKMYGEARFRALCAAGGDDSAENLAESLIAEVRQWAGLKPDEELDDDVTLIIVDVRA